MGSSTQSPIPYEDGIHYSVAADDAGTRIDVFLSHCGDFSRSAWQRLIVQGHVFINGNTARKNCRVETGDAVSAFLPKMQPSSCLPEDIKLDVVYEDNDIIVVNKPQGIAVHPSPGHENGTLVNALLFHCAEGLSGIGGVLRPGIVHRIDMNTSGLIVCAKNDLAHTELSAHLKNHNIERIYECIVRGCPKKDNFTINAPLDRHPSDRKKRAVVEGGRPAITHVEVLARSSKGWSHLRCRLETGRTHQIRVHLAYMGHPIAGDTVYGSGKDEFKLLGQCLHAKQLLLTHPRTKERLSFCADYPDHFKKLMRSIKLYAKDDYK